MDFKTRYAFNPKTDLLGKGGFSKVYKANDILLDRTVALKFFTGSVAEKYRVLNEIKKVIRFEHPNLCKYYDVAVLESQNVMGETEIIEVGIMEYLDAGDFKTYLKNNPQHMDKLLIDVLKGLSYLHKKGIVHRDLKPQNIIIKMEDDEPVAKITDFGISKLLGSEDNNSSALIGTIEYMAPEQFNPRKYGIGGKITTNLDLWSFGLLVYEVLEHKPLFGSRSSGTSAEQVMRNILGEAWFGKIKLLPFKYRNIVNKCLVKDASERVQKAIELIPLFTEEAASSGDIVVFGKDSTSADNSVKPAEVPQEQVYEQNTFQEPEAGLEDQTQVIDLEEENDNEDIPALGTQPDIISDQTQIVHAEYEDVSDKGMNDTVLIPLREEAAREASGVAFEQTPQVEREASTIANSVKKGDAETQGLFQKDKKLIGQAGKKNRIILFTVILLLFITGFFVFRGRNAVETPTGAKDGMKPGTIKAVTTLPRFIAPELVQIEGGSFFMGNDNELATEAESPEHEVHLINFAVSKYEVTVEEFRHFINDTKYVTTAETAGTSGIYKNGKWEPGKGINWRFDSYGQLLDTAIKRLPVVHVSWMDANKYCEWLSGKTRKRYQLPTEAEWEFAAKGGNKSRHFMYSGSDSLQTIAWCSTNSSNKLQPVGQRQSNELGIYDMSGNVMEWCNDWYDENYYKENVDNNPLGPSSGKTRVVRGGSWFLNDNKFFRNTFRAGFPPKITGGQLGFRVCEVRY